MSLRAFNPKEYTRVTDMEVGKVYVLPCTYEGHSAYVKLPDGTVKDQNGNLTDETYFKPLENAKTLAEKLEKSAEHNKKLAEFIRQFAN